MNLKQFSELLGLSQTTVSRALGGYPEVADKTRKRVLLAAQQHGYAPSAAASSLARGRTGAIAHIVPIGQHNIIDPHFADFLAGAGTTYSEQGFDLLMSLVAPSQELATYQRLAQSNRVDGFMVQAPLIDDPRVDLLRNLGLPFLVHGRTEEAAPNEASATPVDFSWLDVNNRRAFARGTRFLADLGHKRIALINGRMDMIFARRRFQGYRDALTGLNLPFEPDLVFSDDMCEPFGFRVCQDLFSRPKDQQPTAILCASVLMAMGVQRAVHERGLVLGKDLSLLTYDDGLSFMGGNTPSVPVFTCLRSSILDAGRKAAHNLIELIKNPDQPPIQEIWEADLILGDSTAPKSR